MTLRLLLGGVLPALAGPAIFWLLLNSSGLTAHQLVERLVELRPVPVMVIAAASAAHIALAGEKWRLVESRFTASYPSRRNAIAYSAIGTALGQFLPPPLANAAIRGAGNRLAGGEGGRRGALTSIWEQLFDLGVIVVLCLPAAAGLVFLNPLLFLPVAAVVAVLVDRVVGPTVALLARIGRLPIQLHDRALSIRLYRLSLARFAILTVITAAVAWAMNSPIEGLRIASVIPPVALGSVLSFLPAGLGVNEWSFVVLLGHWGYAFTTIAAFAIVNRLVVGSMAIALGVVGSFAVNTDRRGARRSAI